MGTQGIANKAGNNSNIIVIVIFMFVLSVVCCERFRLLNITIISNIAPAPLIFGCAGFVLLAMSQFDRNCA